MGEIINLRRVKRVKAREAEAAQAAENRRRAGQTKAERDGLRRERDALARTLDGAKLGKDA